MSWFSELRELRNALVETGSIIYSVWPVTATKQTPGVAIPSKAAADDWGDWTEVIATTDIAGSAFWYIGTQLFSVGAAADNCAVQIGLTDGTGPPPALTRAIDEIQWAKFTAVGTDLGMPFSMVPYPVRLAAASQVSARSASLNAGAKNITISIKVATGL